MSPDVVRLDANRLTVCGDRLVELALSLEHRAEVGMDLGLIRIGRQYLPITGLGLG